MTKFCGWRDLVGIAVQAYRIGAISSDSIEKQKLETLKQGTLFPLLFIPECNHLLQKLCNCLEPNLAKI